MGDNFGLNIPQGQEIGAGMSAVGSILSVIGNMGAASAARRSGRAGRAAADFEAAQLEQNAGQAIASAQRKMIEERRRAALVASRQLAVAAGSGAGASDPTVVNLIADVEGEGAYRAAVALYEGEERARLLRLGADAKRYEGSLIERYGEDRGRAHEIGAGAAGVTGFASLYSKYGRGGPKRAASGGSSGAVGWGDMGSYDADLGISGP